jgi:glycosyltransferase involved in cell wall biosynthesis
MRIHKITVIIPTKNEGEGLEGVINSVKKYCSEVIVIDGHSNDNTKEISLRTGARFFLDHGEGKGDAVRLGLSKATGDIVVIFDSDGSPNSSDIPKLISEIEKGADMVITSRRTGGSFDFELTPNGILRTFGSDLMVYLVNKKFHTRLSDILYNFRAIRKNVGQKLDLKADGFDIEQEMLIRALQGGYKVIEIPSRENARKWGKSKLNTFTGVSLLYKLIKLLYF